MTEYVNHVRVNVNLGKDEVVINFAQECPQFDATKVLSPEPVSNIVMTANLARQLAQLLNSLLDADPQEQVPSEKGE